MDCPLTVFKGGTAFNGLLREFQSHFPHSSYVVPITDDGGSSREIWRVFGGPSIGDIRSTLTRLSDESTLEARAVKKLLEHRLHRFDRESALKEWHALVEDHHPLYSSISSKYKELIRYFLCHFEAERLKKISSDFDLRNGSIGNFFFSGARMALGCLETAIFMYSSVARIPSSTHVLPIIDSNDRLGLGALLLNQERIIGQHMISHPTVDGLVDKSTYTPLPAPIVELYYVDKFKNVMHPHPNPNVIRSLNSSKAIIYGMGSLWTSLIPSLILEGIGEMIASKKCPKIALLNSCYDRETDGMSALDYIYALTNSLNRYGKLSHHPQDYVTHLFMVEGGEIPVDQGALRDLGIEICVIPSDPEESLSIKNLKYPIYSSKELINVIKTL